jgi:hypothetical protein
MPTYIRIHGQVTSWPKLFYFLPHTPRSSLPLLRGQCLWWLREKVQLDRGKVLEKTDEEEGHFIVRKLR